MGILPVDGQARVGALAQWLTACAMLPEHASMSASNYQRYPLGSEALDLGVRVLGPAPGAQA